MSTKKTTRAESVSETLRAAIVDSGVTLQQLGQEAGVDKAALSRFVRGERSLKLESMDRLADRLGLLLRSDTKA